MGQADLKHGSPLMMDYTPAGAVTAGNVVIVGSIPCIAHRAIAASEKGAMAVRGGVYEVTSDGTSGVDGPALVCYWDDTANKVTGTSAGNTRFGYTALDVAAHVDGTKIRCIHDPQVAADPYIFDAVQQALSGAGAITVTEFYTAWTTTGAEAGTLADGTVAGQLKKIQLIVDGGNGTLTPTTLSDGTTITFADAGDYCLLQWSGTSWRVLELGNDADGATAPVLA